MKVIVTVPCSPDFSSTVKYALALSALATPSGLDGAGMGTLSHYRRGNAEGQTCVLGNVIMYSQIHIA